MLKKIALALLLTPLALAEESLLEQRAKEHPTPRKTERYLQRIYAGINDASPHALNSPEEFLAGGLGDEKEVVNTAAEMMQLNSYQVTKLYYKDNTGERYAAYVKDPPQKNNYILQMGWQTIIFPDEEEHLIPYENRSYNPMNPRAWHARRVRQPVLKTGFKNLAAAKAFLSKQGPVREWGTFSYNSTEPEGMKRAKE